MMTALSLRTVAAELDADYAGADLQTERVATDSRQITAGDLYIALRGERFDGHDFIADAAAKGAVAAVVEENAIEKNNSALPQLCVADTRAALGLVARMNRRAFAGPVIGITGSAGKTTCKEMLAAILAQSGAVLATAGNLNNEIGVPLTLLKIAPQHRFAVVEMGAARAGDIAYLCRFAEPDVGIVTTAMPVHLEGFGDIDTVANTKGELFAGLRADGVAIINADSEYASRWKKLADARRVVTFGLNADAMVSARAIRRTSEGLQFQLINEDRQIDIELPLLGAHNVRNALAAAAAALVLGISLEAIRAALMTLRPVPGRLQTRRGAQGNIVIDDSYNANPEAAKAAIDVLAEYAGRRRLMLGNMGELGPEAAEFHREVARYAAASAIEECWFVGPHAQLQVDEFARFDKNVSEENKRARYFVDNAGMIAANLQQPNVDAILVKGSRSAGMETIVAALCGDDSTNGGVH
jgi:UDP-N-acetylmuramoyl-tripeptide--D-alanyl-D-alanine ligase